MSSPARRSSKRNSVPNTPTRSARASSQAVPPSSSPIQGASSSQPASSAAPAASQGSQPQRRGILKNVRQNVVASSSPVQYAATSSPKIPSSSAGPSGSSSHRRHASAGADLNATPKGNARTARGEIDQIISRFLISNSMTDSSPIAYMSSSSAVHTPARRGQSGGSGLFLSSSAATPVPGSSNKMGSRRGDIHSDLGSVTSRRRRILLDASGNLLHDGNSDAATFSDLDPNTSEANVAGGGNSARMIWGTNVSIQDSMSAFRDFLQNFKRKYRMWHEGAAEDDEEANGPRGQELQYMKMLETMQALGLSNLNLEVSDLKAYPPTIKLWHQLQAYPQEIIPIMDQIIKEVMVEIVTQKIQSSRSQPSQTRRRARSAAASSDINFPSSDPKAPTDEEQRLEQSQVDADMLNDVETRPYKVRPFGLATSINLRDLNPSDMDKMICVKGLVIRTTPVIPDMKEAFFRCQMCNHTLTVDIDRGKIAEPAKCPRQICGADNSMQIVHNRSGFADKQVIKLQETPDSVPDGQTPHSVSLCAYDDLVDVCKAGDRIVITGIFRCNPVRINPRQRSVKSLFKTYVDVLHIQKSDKKRMGIDTTTLEQEVSDQVAQDVQEARKFSEEEEYKIRVTAGRPDIYELLSRSLAPSIYEADDVKKGILLQLFGGTNKTFKKGGSPRYRGDINILLCGDPSTAKSQLLKYVHKIAPRGIYTSGKGSSAVGLTAYITRDPETRQLVLESGALVLSDGGVCCIDEFDKMNDSTRSVLHEVMEQQTVSVAKAGIITTLNARTSILASANPIGSKYNPNLPVPQNIDLPPTLLSRFDLVYLVLDRIDEQNDRRLAKHLVGMYLEDAPENASSQEILVSRLVFPFILQLLTHYY
jgi:DNA replication licensing factor MCM4